MTEYVIESTSISFYNGPIYWSGIPGEGSNWVRGLSAAEPMSRERAERLAAALRDYELAVEVRELVEKPGYVLATKAVL